MREVDLPSGAKLKIMKSPFEAARDLYQAIAAEVATVDADAEKEIDANFLKGLFCVGLASKKIETALWKCMSYCTYNGEKITKDTFEPESAREDYFEIMFEVATDNVKPFTKSLYAKFSAVLAMMSTKSRE